MPIRPENRARYPADWPDISLRIRSLAGNCCENCAARNGAWGWRDADGEFHEVNKRVLSMAGYGPPPFDFYVMHKGPDDIQIRQDVRIIRIILTVAHLNHTPEDCRPENLRAWCQRCHLRYDAPSKAARRFERDRAGAASGDLISQSPLPLPESRETVRA